MGLDIYLASIPEVCESEEDDIGNGVRSTLYPNHNWSPIYLRSSYNPIGFNHVVGNLTGKSLHYIFNYVSETDRFYPDWEESLKRAREVLSNLKGCKPMFVESVYFYDHPEYPKSEADALRIAQKQLSSSGQFEAWSSREGMFSRDGLTILAAVPGKSIIGGPCVYLITKGDLSWYIQALEILIEEFIPLGMQHSDTAYMVWSG